MCCFSGEVTDVGSTRIFARPSEAGRQLLVYQMDVRARGEVAMFLPLTVPDRCPEDAVRFVYVQIGLAEDPRMDEPAGYEYVEADRPLSSVMDLNRTAGLVQPSAASYRRLLQGWSENRNVTLSLPPT